ncbi:branched-chain amino acid transporter AzlD [Mangrovactinospora gilvigrisea]|uniref:Branched-chain amino acid transporter AzlD n=1 Tax=Mangrovactinospora gilvigrisea TaxID=1428644 RepID=A0A1J7BT16_9ACTN|nr:AzlD domain-containing protein [Mangrovactinospora gilvigrisea]OIV36609.1 branched-chain amino acid transporter AzlD [Mangrovactinospora gilvigrisea]
MTAAWWAIAATAAGCYLLKLAGLSLPSGWLERAAVQRFAGLVPVALLAGLTAVQTFGSSRHAGQLTVDARAAGIAAALLALRLRAPFLVVIVSAVAVTVLLRAVL